MKNTWKQLKRKAAGAIVMGATMIPNYVYAEEQGGVDSVTTPLKNLKTLILSVVALVGVFIIIKGVIELAEGIQQQDSSGVSHGVKTIISGLLIASIGTVLTFLGIK